LENPPEFVFDNPICADIALKEGDGMYRDGGVGSEEREWCDGEK